VAEKDGKILERGFLSADGRILRRSQTTALRLDPEGSPVEDAIHLVDGKPAEMLPSAFEQENPLTPVPLSRLAVFAVSDVYPIDAISIDPGLYETTFTYRRAIQPKEALLLVQVESSAYLLTGATKEATFLGHDVTYSFFSDDSEDAENDEDLDFSMI
jgi:hypothetical protein